MKPTIVRGIVAAAALAVTLTACSTGAGSGGSSASGSSSAASAPSGSSVIDRTLTATVGPNGEKPTPVSELTLTDAEVAKLQVGHYTAAQLWHTNSQFVSAVQAGAAAEFGRLGIDVTATTNANMDAGTQANQVQTAMAKKPNVIIGLPVDPTSAAAAFQPAVDAGTKLVFLSNVPKGYTYGKQYTSIVTDDLYEMGKQAAEALGKALNGKGEVAIVFYNAQYYVTNQRDAAFRTTLKKEFPGIKIVAEQGFSDPNNATSIANALLTQHPKLSGIYTSWSQPAEGVLSALRTVGNTTTKVVTLDVDDPVVVDMATGGNTVGLVADKAYELGKGMADAAAYALLGKTAPPFAVAGVLTITKDSIPQGYQDSLHSDVPSAVQKVLK
ncbi:MAG: ABC-type sugar transport system periplasmic component [Frankiales bacterium]|nr:ABC-type sugar transport system periplasmic component [Frankiales bacterium]